MEGDFSDHKCGKKRICNMTKNEICARLKRFFPEGPRTKGKRTKFIIHSGLHSTIILVGKKTTLLHILKKDEMILFLTLRNSLMEAIGFSESSLMIRMENNPFPISISLKAKATNRRDLAERIKDKHIELYTDGGCKGNGHDGVWCYMIVSEDRLIASMTRYRKDTTSMEMEKSAIVNGLRRLQKTKPRDITVYSDCLNLIIPMIDENQKGNRHIKEIRRVSEKLTCPVHWKWVKAHSSTYWNIQCDKAVRKRYP